MVVIPEDGIIYYFSGALNFPKRPCSGPVDCLTSTARLPGGVLESWVKHYSEALTTHRAAPSPYSTSAPDTCREGSCPGTPPAVLGSRCLSLPASEKQAKEYFPPLTPSGCGKQERLREEKTAWETGRALRASPVCAEHAASGQEGIEHLNPSGLNPWPTGPLHCAGADVRQEGGGPPERIPCSPRSAPHIRGCLTTVDTFLQGCGGPSEHFWLKVRSL